MPLPALDYGQGSRVVLCLHGLFGGAEAWHRAGAYLARDYRVVIPELPLFYDWGWLDPLAPTLEQLREAVVAFCREKDLSAVALCGSSLGGAAGLGSVSPS